MNRDEQQRFRRMKANLREIKRARHECYVIEHLIVMLAEQDFEAQCPNNYENILGYMNRYGYWSHYLLDCLLGHQNGVNMSGAQESVYQVEDRRASIDNLRLTIMSWVRKFEGWPTEAERLEELMTRQTEVEAKAEEVEARRTGGASLLRANGA